MSEANRSAGGIDHITRQSIRPRVKINRRHGLALATFTGTAAQKTGGDRHSEGIGAVAQDKIGVIVRAERDSKRTGAEDGGTD
jgi:hypothetical protein